MEGMASLEPMALGQDRRISEVVERERFRQRIRERFGLGPSGSEPG
jgi:hypothetical protein